jgi:GntR family transcriptional regulator
MHAAAPPQLRRLRFGPPGRAARKYLLLSDALASAIDRGVWRPGDRLPTEKVLAASLPFSLGTIQRALRLLVADGVLVRRHRSGTFVSAPRRAMQQPWHCRFLNDDGTDVLPVYPRIVRRELTRERGTWSRHLGSTPRGVVRIDRIIEINGEFCVYNKFFADAARFGSLLKRPLAELNSANFKLVLAREYHLRVAALAHTLTVSLLPREVSAALQLAASTMGSVIEARGATARGAPVYFQQMFVPPNPRRLVVSDVLRPLP